MLTLEAQLKAACESDLRLETPAKFPEFGDFDVFCKEYFLYNLLRKEEPFTSKKEVPIGVLRDSLAKFADSEWRCRVMNLCGRFTSPICEADMLLFQETTRLAKAWISNTMMDRWPRWESARYTSGASRNSSRKQSMSYLKQAGYSEKGIMSATASAFAIVDTMIAPEFGPLWPRSDVEIVNDCRFDFVHKTAKSVRFMTLQPEYNMLAQCCVGDCVSAALVPFGIDLTDQGRNQDLAYRGSITRGIATIDLSNSSDNVALQHGEMFLPDRLLDMCMATRVTHATVGEVSHRLNKLATMGNGFIFEIQSLIYAGIAHAITALHQGEESDIAVYGDDIVISTNCAQPLMDYLVHIGMEPNMEKSYWGDTPFRESCGEHYFAGRSVTPFYVKKKLVGLRALFRCLNGLLYWQQRTGFALPSAIKLLVAAIPKKDRLVVPSTYSIDCGIHFPVSGCTFPKRIVTPHGDLRISFSMLTDKTQDIKGRIGDEALYRDWLNNPPMQLVSDDIWKKFWLPKGPFAKAMLHGDPLVAKSYSRDMDTEKYPPMWTRVTACLD